MFRSGERRGSLHFPARTWFCRVVVHAQADRFRSAFESRKEPNVESRTPLSATAKRLEDALRDGRMKREQLRRRRPSGKAATERHHVAELAQRA
jgi:hypothetical protein